MKNDPVTTHSLLSSSCNSFEPKLDQLIDINRFSGMKKSIRVTAYVIRFLDKIKNKSKEQTHCLRANDVASAERLWIKSVRASSFADELSFLTTRKESASAPIRVMQFGLFLVEDGIIRCKGRINNAVLSTSTKNPILLPAKHAFVSLLVKQTHDVVKHAGNKDILTTLRERFWILRGRQTVKKIIRHCVCRRFEGIPFNPATTAC